MAQTETRLIGPELCEGNIRSATYFSTLDNESNQRFMPLWRSRVGDQPTSMWSEMAYNQVHLFSRALERVGSLETHRVVKGVHNVLSGYGRVGQNRTVPSGSAPDPA